MAIHLFNTVIIGMECRRVTITIGYKCHSRGVITKLIHSDDHNSWRSRFFFVDISNSFLIGYSNFKISYIFSLRKCSVFSNFAKRKRIIIIIIINVE